MVKVVHTTDDMFGILLRVIDNLLDSHLAMSIFSRESRNKLAEYIALGLTNSDNYVDNTYLAIIRDQEEIQLGEQMSNDRFFRYLDQADRLLETAQEQESNPDWASKLRAIADTYLHAATLCMQADS